ALPTLPEGVAAEGVVDGLAERPDAAAGTGTSGGGFVQPAEARCGRGGFMSMPPISTPASTPVLGRQQGLSSTRLRPVPYTPLVGAAPTVAAVAAAASQPPLPRGAGGALAVAMAAAKAAAGAATAPPPTLRTRLALVFSTVHDAVCFCVHMQAMLTNCRWSPEVLELPDCKPIAVRPRAVGTDGQQAAAGGGGGGGGDGPAGGAAAPGKGGAASAAGNAGAGTDAGGGVVLASTQSSFVASSSPSPFSPSGAVDKMRSLISAGVKGRSGRTLRPAVASPRLTAHGSGPDRSGLSVSRFAAASAGLAGSGSAAGVFGARSLMPYGSAHVSYDPWGGGGAASSAGVSRSGSTTAWGAPLFNGSFGAAAGGGGGPSTGPHAPSRSPLGRLSRGAGGGGSPAYGSPYYGMPATGSASMPLPKLPAAAQVASALALPSHFYHRTGVAGAGAGAATGPPPTVLPPAPPPPPPQSGWPLATHRTATGVAVPAVPGGGGGGSVSYDNEQRDGVAVGGGGDGDGDGGDAAMAGPAVFGSVQSGLSQGGREIADIVIGSLDSDPDGPLELGKKRVGALGAGSGPGSLPPPSEAPPPGGFSPAPSPSSTSHLRRSYQAVTVSQLPLVQQQQQQSQHPVQVYPLSLLQTQPASAPIDSSSLVGSASTLVMAGYDLHAAAASPAAAAPASLPLPLAAGPDSDAAAASFSLAGMPAAALLDDGGGGGGSCEWPRRSGGDLTAMPRELPARELGLGLAAAGPRDEPALEVIPPPPAVGAALVDVYQAWVPPPLPSDGRPVAEGAEDTTWTNGIVVTGGSSSCCADGPVDNCERTGAAGAAEAEPPPPRDVARPNAVAVHASLGGGGGGGWRPWRLAHPQPAMSLASSAAGAVSPVLDAGAAGAGAAGAGAAGAAGASFVTGTGIAGPASPAASLPLPLPLPFPPVALKPHVQAVSPLFGRPSSRFQLMTHWSAASNGGGGGGGDSGVQCPVAASAIAAQFNGRAGPAAAAVWATAAAAALLPPPSPLADRPHASVPLMKIQLDEQEITPQYSAVSTNLMRLNACSYISGVVQNGVYDNAAAVASGCMGDGGDDGGCGTGAHAAALATLPAARPIVRSFGDQVRMTFEALEGVERSDPEAEVTVIFRGPRVVCGISTWQYGDEEGTAEYGGRRSGCGADEDDEDKDDEDEDEDDDEGQDEGERTDDNELYEISPVATANDGIGGGSGPLLASPPPPQQQQQQQRTTSHGPMLLDRVAPNCGQMPPLAVVPSGGGGGGGGGEYMDAAADDGGAAATAATAECLSYASLMNPLFNVATDGGGRTEDAERLDGAVAGASSGGCGAAGRSRGLSAGRREQWRRRRMPAPLRRALAICESGQGGFVLLDGATYSASSQEALQEQCMILHLGEYLLSGTGPGCHPSNLDLYLALDFAHLARLAHLRPLACAEQLSLGLPSAPVNSASICFSLVTGMQTLLAWNGEVAKAALGRLRDAALPALLHHGGYLVEDADGLLLTAFPSSRSALAWALECQDEAKHLDWPEELLGHVLGEAVYVDDDLAAADEKQGQEGQQGQQGQEGQQEGPAHSVEDGGGGQSSGGDGMPTALGGGGGGGGGGARRHLVFRGLRIKSGLDCGDVLARVHATTGRMTYRGRVMNRAARIAGMATAGQVLCSRGLWDSSGLAVSPDLCQQALAVGESMGEVQLKGLSAKMEVINCVRILRSEMAPPHLDLQQQQELQPEEALSMSRLPEGYGQDHFQLGEHAAVGVGVAAGAAAAAGSLSDGPRPPPLPLELLGSAADAASPVLMQAVPLLSDSDSDSGGGGGGGGVALGGADGAGVAANGGAGDSDSARELASAIAADGVSGVARDRALAAVTAAPERRTPAGVAADAAAAAALESEAAIARASVISRASLTNMAGDGQRCTPSKSPLATAPSGTASTSASLAAALAAARIRRASMLRSSRCLHTSGMPLDRAAAAGGGNGGSTVLGSVLLAEDDEDDIADRLVAGFSSEGSGDGSDGGGSGSDGSAAGVAALHGMLRRQRPQPTGGAGHSGTFPAAAAAAAAAGQGGAGGGGGAAAAGAPKGHLASNFKKALRAVKRSLVDEPGGGGSGSDGSVSDGGRGERPSGFSTAAAAAAGDPVARLRRPPPRRKSELIKPSTLTGAAGAGGGGARLLNHLRSLATNRGRGRGGGDLYGEEEEDESRFRPTASANSEFFPSRTGSSMLSATRSHLLLRGVGGGGGSGVPFAAGQRSGGGNADTTGGDIGGGAAAANRVSAANGGSGGGGGLFGHTSSRLAGGSLVAEMSLASMTMRRHMPVSQLLGTAVSAGKRSFRSVALAVDTTSSGGGGGGGASAATPAAISPSTALPTSSPPPSQSFRKALSYRRGTPAFGAEDITYGIQENDGEEEEEQGDGAGDGDRRRSTEGDDDAAVDADPAARSWAASLRRSSETRRPSSIAQGGSGTLAAAPSLPSRLASFTSSFLQRSMSKRWGGGAAAAAAPGQTLPDGAGDSRPWSGASQLDVAAAAAAAVSRDVSGSRPASTHRTAGGDGGEGGGSRDHGSGAAPRTSAGGGGHDGSAAAAAAAARPTGRLLSRIASLRRPGEKALESSGGGGGGSVPAQESKFRRPSDSLLASAATSVLPHSATAGASISPSRAPPTATASLSTRGSHPLGRSATGLGSAFGAEAATELGDRPRSSGQEGHGAVPPAALGAPSQPGCLVAPAVTAGGSGASAATVAAALHTLPSSRSINARWSSPHVDAHGPGGSVGSGGGGMYGSGGGYGGGSVRIPAGAAGGAAAATAGSGGGGMYGSGGGYGGGSVRIPAGAAGGAAAATAGSGGGGMYGSGGGYGGGSVRIPAGAAGGAAAATAGSGGGGGGVAASSTHAGDHTVGAGGSAWGSLFSSLHNFLGLSHQSGAGRGGAGQGGAGQTGAGQGGAAAGATCPNSPRASVVRQPSSTVLGGGSGGGSGGNGGRAGRRRSQQHHTIEDAADGGGAGSGGGSGGNGRAGRRRSQQHHTIEDAADGGGGTGGGGGGGLNSSSHAAVAATPRNRRRSVIEVSGNVLILNVGASYAAGGDWPLAVESENYGYAGGSTMLADTSYGGGLLAVGGGGAAAAAAADGDALYGGAFDVSELLDRGGFNPQPSAAFNAASGSLPGPAAGRAAAAAGDAPGSPRHRQSARRLSALLGNGGGGGGGGAKSRTDAGDRTFSPRRQPSRVSKAGGGGGEGGGEGGGGGTRGGTWDSLPVRQPPPPSSSAGAAAAASNAALQVQRPGPSAGGGHELETGSSGGGLGRLVRGLSGLVSRGSSTARDGGGGGGRHPFGSSRRVSGSNRYPNVTSGAAVARSSGSASLMGQTGSPVLSAAAAATALALHTSRGSGGVGGVGGGGSGSDSDALGQQSASPRVRATATAPGCGSASGEAAAAAPAGRRLVPELARSARELVSRALTSRSTYSAGSGGGGAGSGSEGGGSGRVGGGFSPDRDRDRHGALSPLHDPPAALQWEVSISPVEQDRVPDSSVYWRQEREQQPQPQLHPPQELAGRGAAQQGCDGPGLGVADGSPTAVSPACHRGDVDADAGADAGWPGDDDVGAVGGEGVGAELA
ncbi:hypothetical protein PLESTB_000674900, partial [Pleodorina starrii]